MWNHHNLGIRWQVIIWYCMLVAGIPHLDSKSSGTSTKSCLRYLSLQRELLLSLQLEPLHVEWRQLHTFHHNLPCCWDSFASPSLPAQYRRQIYLSIGSTMLNTINKATESNARQFSLFQLVLYSTQPQISEDKNDHTVDICSLYSSIGFHRSILHDSMHLYAIIPVAGLSQDASYLFEALGCGLQSSHLGTEHCAMLNDFLKDVSHCLTTFNDSTGIKPPVGHLMSFKRCSKWVWYLYSWCFCKYFRGGFATTLPAFAPWTFWQNCFRGALA